MTISNTLSTFLKVLPLLDKKKFSTIYVFWTGRDLPKEVVDWTYLTTLAIKGDLMCHYFLEEAK